MERKKEAAFGEQLRKIRTRRGTTLAELAKYVGVHVSYIAKIEVGELPPPVFDKIILMAVALKSPELLEFGRIALIEDFKRRIGEAFDRLDQLEDHIRTIMFGDYEKVKSEAYAFIDEDIAGDMAAGVEEWKERLDELASLRSGTAETRVKKRTKQTGKKSEKRASRSNRK